MCVQNSSCGNRVISLLLLLATSGTSLGASKLLKCLLSKYIKSASCIQQFAPEMRLHCSSSSRFHSAIYMHVLNSITQHFMCTISLTVGLLLTLTRSSPRALGISCRLEYVLSRLPCYRTFGCFSIGKTPKLNLASKGTLPPVASSSTVDIFTLFTHSCRTHARERLGRGSDMVNCYSLRALYSVKATEFK